MLSNSTPVRARLSSTGVTPFSPPTLPTNLLVKLSRITNNTLGRASARMLVVESVGAGCPTASGYSPATSRRAVLSGINGAGGRSSLRSSSALIRFQGALMAAWLAKAVREKYTSLWLMGICWVPPRSGTSSSARYSRQASAARPRPNQAGNSASRPTTPLYNSQPPPASTASAASSSPSGALPADAAISCGELRYCSGVSSSRKPQARYSSRSAVSSTASSRPTVAE